MLVYQRVVILFFFLVNSWFCVVLWFQDTLKKGQPVRRMTAWCLCGCLRQMDATYYSIFMVVYKEFEFNKRPKNLKLVNPQVFHNSRNYHVFVRPDGTQLFTISTSSTSIHVNRYTYLTLPVWVPYMLWKKKLSIQHVPMGLYHACLDVPQHRGGRW